MGAKWLGLISHLGWDKLILPVQTCVLRISLSKVGGEGPIPLVCGHGTLLKITEAYPTLGTPRQVLLPKGSKRISLYFEISVYASLPSKTRMKL